jgi:hypothetical protein
MKRLTVLRALAAPVLVFCALVQAADSDLTPSVGDPVRQAVIDGLRREMAALHGMDLVFVVESLKVQNGWAWIVTLPQSPDGTNRYEGVSALLRLVDGVWKVADLPCTEEDDPECLGDADYYERLLIRYPGVPREILPEVD